MSGLTIVKNTRTLMRVIVDDESGVTLNLTNTPADADVPITEVDGFAEAQAERDARAAERDARAADFDQRLDALEAR